MTEELSTFLSDSMISAPASTMKDLNNAFEGGLIDHTLRVTKYAVSLNDVLPDALKIDLPSLIKVCCLHQIGKAHLFKPNESEWHRDNLGKMYEYNNELVSLKVGERSAYYAQAYGVKLSEVEYQAIVNYEKTDYDKQSKWHTEPLGVILRMANRLAIMEETTNG
jgi:hypothetical protein